MQVCHVSKVRSFSYRESKIKAISNYKSFLFLVRSSLCRSGNSESLKIPQGHCQVCKLTNHLICREVQVIRDFFMSYFKGASMSGSLIALRGIFFRSRSRGWRKSHTLEAFTNGKATHLYPKSESHCFGSGTLHTTKS